ncbi:putative flavin-binding monooxygenase [Xylaria scruposa]|nr:putative flavin-binding monooxygenase [Xylaria scruposa]
MASHLPIDDDGETFDVIIVGAGISGINCAYRLQTELPHLKLLVLEARDNIGGTWDLYRYPGVRSDSDIYTMGFAWHPWSFDHPIATGNQIMEYLTAAVSKHQLDRFIRFRHRVLSADWSAAQRSWTLSITQQNSPPKSIMSRWIVLGTGYYDYESPAQPAVPGLESFKGKLINPQFWPTDFDYTNKRIVVIGSGATAVSLLPALPDKAAQVTMIQRSPTYIAASPNTAWGQRFFPRYLVDRFRRIRYLISPYILVLLCRYFPNIVRDGLRKETINLLPKHIDFDTHFKPRYNPWDQRICLDPDAAFYKALHLPNVKIITGEIESVTDDTIKMSDDKIVAADVLITATGFRMMMGGKIDLRLDGKPISWQKRYIWNGAMLDSVPNMMFMLGYTNHAWTLGADDTAIILTRLLKHMEKMSMSSAEARVPPKAATDTQRMWQLNATYVLAADGELPVYGMTGNWKPRNRPPLDYVHARWGDFTSDLRFSA